MLNGKYDAVLTRAVKAIKDRQFFSQYAEHPKAYGDEAMAESEGMFTKLLDCPFDLLQDGESGRCGEEISPLTGKKLGITYPVYTVDCLISHAQHAQHAWGAVSISERSALLIESLEKMKTLFFQLAHATMHTTGQGFLMSFQSSGPHAADRALEAIAMGWRELTLFPPSVTWEKTMGKSVIRLEKTFRAVPRGVSVVVSCSTFPVWNTLPGLYASLVTGNPVIVKPHPGAVLPIALVVRAIQATLVENQYDPNLCQLAPDDSTHLITKSLCNHPEVKLIDYTGSTAFGNELESIAGKTVFTEKSGVNTVILDSMKDVQAVIQNLAFSVSLYSGQMCTAPQNIFIPECGIKIPNGTVGYEDFVQQFLEAVEVLVTNPKTGPGTLGAIQNAVTMERLAMARTIHGTIILESQKPMNPEFPHARVASPLIIALNARDREVFEQEFFGPVVFIIKTSGTAESIDLARDLALRKGAITCAAYTTDAQTMDLIAERMNEVFTPVSFNFIGNIWVNQHAAFSDFHVTGGNPAGNASLTNPEFLEKRFVWVGNRFMT